MCGLNLEVGKTYQTGLIAYEQFIVLFKIGEEEYLIKIGNKEIIATLRRYDKDQYIIRLSYLYTGEAGYINDLVEYDPKKKYKDWLLSLKKDDPVVVLNNNREEYKRHFAEIQSCAIYCWYNGLTSFSIDWPDQFISWINVRHPDGTILEVSEYLE